MISGGDMGEQVIEVCIGCLGTIYRFIRSMEVWVSKIYHPLILQCLVNKVENSKPNQRE